MTLVRGIWRWLTSRAVRRAVDQHRIVRRLFAFQRDRLPPEVANEIRDALDELHRRLGTAESVPLIHESSGRLKAIADRCLDGVARRLHRESLEILVIGCVGVLAVRTFFLQPMTIPTGSMQPTLNGNTIEDVRRAPEVVFPEGVDRFVQAVVYGKRHFHFVAKTNGYLTAIGPVEPAYPWLRFVPFWRKQDFIVGGFRYRIWSPPLELPNPFPLPPDQAIFGHARLRPHRLYRAGENLMKLVYTAGDRVLVDRMTYNFRRPRRGEIVVFKSNGIADIQEGTHYMKRLVATGGETVRIGDDRHVVVDDVRLDAHTPGFERVYSFSGPPQDGEYAGHLNDATARRYRMPPGVVAPRFPNERTEMRVRAGHYLVLGDNTVSSLDGRRWGDFREELVVGRFWMVYWPISGRFGWSAR